MVVEGGKRETDIRGGVKGKEENARMFSLLASHSDAAISIRASFPSPPPLLTPGGIDRSAAAGIGANESTTYIF